VQTLLAVGGGRLDPTLEQRVTVENLGDAELEARLGVEWAITLLGGGGNPDAWWEVDGHRSRHDGAGSSEALGRIVQGNNWLGVEVETTVDQQADAWFAPIETVSNSEAGFERVYQGSALLLSWQVTIEPGARWSTTIRQVARIAEDRAEQEVSGPNAPQPATLA
jgi:4-alpha-glucanotransferase